MITLEEAHEWFSYDPETGVMRWKKRKAQTIHVGDEAGIKLDFAGYKNVLFNGKRYKIHRLAWFMTHGYWPEAVDHINRVTYDNTMANLRSVTKAQNMQNQLRTNNKYLPGVTKQRNFVAQISVNGKGVYLGTFKEEMQAHLAYMEAKAKYHKFWNGK